MVVSKHPLCQRVPGWPQSALLVWKYCQYRGYRWSDCKGAYFKRLPTVALPTVYCLDLNSGTITALFEPTSISVEGGNWTVGPTPGNQVVTTFIAGSEAALVINAGRDVMVPLGKEGVLDGSQSYASDGATVRFHWQSHLSPGNAPVVLANADSAQATFTPGRAGDYLFKLEIADSTGRKAFAYKLVTVSDDFPSIIGNPLEIRTLADGRVELQWPEAVSAYPEESSGLTVDAWSRFVHQSQPVNGNRVIQLTPTQLHRFFRLRPQP